METHVILNPSDYDVGEEDGDEDSSLENSYKIEYSPYLESWTWEIIKHYAVVRCLEVWGTLSNEKLLKGIGANASAAPAVSGIRSTLFQEGNLVKTGNGEWSFVSFPGHPAYAFIKP